MSKQNYAKTILVLAFQDEFLLEILSRFHILKVQNSNLKQTEVFKGLELHFETNHCPKLYFETDHFQNSFRGRLVF
ncbi:hypothetical protein RclHR1_07010012 [Rhizophagus clarus]|uniref:Uncharacterized protein n=1 Tax=Rhizophagus clarus TaxID=94130 RepID=A0A2Z6RUN7_9GLOM|nr:hypothetical protein RclHR1_07010012 [Rhizophagus clarus]